MELVVHTYTIPQVPPIYTSNGATFLCQQQLHKLSLFFTKQPQREFSTKMGPLSKFVIFVCSVFNSSVLQNKSHFDKVENIVVKRQLFQTPWGRCLCFPLQLFPNPVNIIWNIVCQTTENSIESPEGYSVFFLMFFGLSVKHSGHKLCCVFPIVKYLISTYTL